MANAGFDIRSPKKLGHMLFDILGMAPVEFSDRTGNPSTSEGCIIKLLEKHPMSKELNELWKDCGGSSQMFLAQARKTYAASAEVWQQVEGFFILKSVLELRGLEKERNTYAAQLENYTVDDILHPGFSMHKTVTGRLASSDPAIQNFPKKSLLRKCFRSRFGDEGILLQADGSQMELRVLAEISGDHNLRLAYCGNPETGEGPKDIHRMTASEVFRLPEWDRKLEDGETEKAMSLLGGRGWGELTNSYREWVAQGGNHRGKNIPGIPTAFSKSYLVLPKGYKDEKAFKSTDMDEDLCLYLRGVGEAERGPSKCFHPDTEVLTKSGWKKIIHLLPEEEILQAIPGDGKGIPVQLEWVVPTEVFTKKHPSEKLIHLKNEGIDIRVTPDHRMLVWGSTYKHKVVMPEEFNQQRYFANAGILKGTTPSDPGRTPLLRLMVATQADGSFDAWGAVKFGFSKDRKTDRLRMLLVQADVKFTEHSTDTVTTFHVSRENKNAFTEGFLDHDKQFTWDLLALPEWERRIIVDEAKHWDAHQAKNWSMFVYSSVKEKNVDVLQALAASIGRKTYKRWNGKMWVLSVKDHHTSRGENVKTTEEVFTDEVACLSVPSTFVLVRSNGIPLICGQTINFGIIYGMSAVGLAAQLGITRFQAEEYIEAYFRKFPGVKTFINKVKEKTLKTGKVTSMFGRIRRLPEVYSDDRMVKEEALRQAVNFLVQSAASDITLESYYEFNTWLRQSGLRSVPWALIHDAIDADVHLDEFAIVAPKVKACMENNRYGWTVPLVADVEIGENWKDMEKVTKLLEEQG